MAAEPRRHGLASDFPQKRNRALLPIFLVGLVLLGGGIVGMRVRLSVSGSGVIEAREYSRLYAPRSGIVAQVLVEVGEVVEAGQPLLRLSPLMEERSLLQQTEAEMELLKLQRSLLELEAEQQAIAVMAPDIVSAPARAEALGEIAALEGQIERSLATLNETSAVSSLEYYRQRIQSLRTQAERLEEEAKAELAGSELASLVEEIFGARKSLLEGEVAKRKKYLERVAEESVLRSPASGRVASLTFTYVGEPVQEGHLVAEIVGAEDAYQARVWVGQQNIDLIAPGAEAQLSSQVFNSRLEGYLRGKVESVSPLPEEGAGADDPAATGPRYELIVAIEETPYPLAYGSTVEAEIFIGRGSLWEAMTGRPSDLRLSQNKEGD